MRNILIAYREICFVKARPGIDSNRADQRGVG